MYLMPIIIQPIKPMPILDTDLSWFESVISFLESIWEGITFAIGQVTASIRFLFTAMQMTDIISYVLPISLASIALITIGIAFVKAVLGR